LQDLQYDLRIQGLEYSELPRLVVRSHVGSGVSLDGAGLNEGKGSTTEDEQQDERDKEQPAKKIPGGILLLFRIQSGASPHRVFS
jgi:hypothetical protein